MASSSPDIGDNLDELNCSVCLDIYEEPVGLPCGHSFCCDCIEKYWESRDEDTYCVCPNCREVFPQKPKLKKNVTIAYLVEKIVNVKKGMNSGGTGSLCEVCDRKASKRCVPCEILCCDRHVKPHQEKGHKLVEPGMNVEELRCTNHGKPIHLYCKDDESFLCLMCMAEEHRDHKFVPLEFTQTELKDALAEKYPQAVNSMEDLEAELQELQQKFVQTQGHTDLVKRFESVLQFRSLSMAPSTVLGISQEEKNLDLLVKVYKNILKEIQKDPVKELEVVELDQIIMRSFYGRTPSLDPNSANPRIKISQDLRTATLTGTERPYPEHPDRFDYWFQVVSSESFSSGRHYWEVDVSSTGSYGIGICLNSMERKGGFSGLGMNPESWCLEKHNNKYTACHSDQDTLLFLPGDPERFGFFLDCEAGELTCFGDSQVLHVFRGNFMDPVKPAIGVHYPVGGSIQFFSF